MLIPFHQLPSHARIWVYQANRNLTDIEVNHIQKTLESQVNNWAAHGAPLLASAKVFYDRFVVVGLDENQNAASGCSIDVSTHWLKDLGAALGIDFFNRSILFWQNEELKSVEMLQIKVLVAEEIINPETLIFNNLVSNLQDFLNNWQVKAGDSWMKRYFKVRQISNLSM